MLGSDTPKVLVRAGAFCLALSLALPMTLPRGSGLRLVCYVMAAISITTCLIGARKLKDRKTSQAVADAVILSDPPLLHTPADAADVGLSGDGD